MFSAISQNWYFHGNLFKISVSAKYMTKKCATPNCNNNHDGRPCNGCSRDFCENCFEDFETDYENDYSDPEYPEGTMLDTPMRYCNKCS